jgi:hypothetical protein
MTKGDNQVTNKRGIKSSTLGSVSLGAKFVFRTAKVLGHEDATHFKPPFEGQVLTVVGFKPRLKNNVVVREPNGNESLMPLDMVEKALEPEVQ